MPVDMEMVAIALRHPELVNTVDSETGRTLLHLLCEPGPAGTVDVNILSQLVDLGGDPKIADKAGKTPLSVAAEAAVAGPSQLPAMRALGGDDPAEAVRMLVMRGVPCPTFADGADPAAQALVQEHVNQCNRFKGDLWGYAEDGHTRQARDLIAATPHAPVDAYDSDQGLNALMFAVLHRQDGMVELLLQSGADPNALDNDGHAPLHLICNPFGHETRGNVQRTETARERCAEHLLQYGADVNLADKAGQTPLHVACSAGLQGMVRGFILNGAELSSNRAALAGWVAEDPDAPDLDGVSASALAAIESTAVREVAGAAITKLLDMEPQANEGIVSSLVAGGVNEHGAQRATLAVMHAQPGLTPDETLHEAHAWALQHQEDTDFVDPVPFGWRPILTETPRTFDSQFTGMDIHTRVADAMMPPEGVPDDPRAQRRRRRPRMAPKDVVPFTERAVVSQSIDSPGVDDQESSDEDEKDAVFGGEALSRQYSMADTDAFDSALDKPWESLSGEEVTAAQVLGYTEKEWPQPCKEEDEWPTWEEAAAEERAAWVALGRDEEAWPPGSELMGGLWGDDARSKSWTDLTEEEQEAARVLGWDERSFTEDAFSRYIDLAYRDLSEEQQQAVDTLEIDESDWDQMTAEQEEIQIDKHAGTIDPGAGEHDGGGDDGSELVRAGSTKLSARAGFSMIDKADLFKERSLMIDKASQMFGLSAAAAAAIMKKFHWDYGAARKKYRECDDDPFQFSAAMKVVSDLAEGVVVSDGTETVFDEVMFEDTEEWTSLSCGHKFADTTWESYIQTAITSGSKETGEATGLTCITGGCHVPVPESMILRFAGEHTEKYKRFVGDMWISEQADGVDIPKLKFCPFPDCGHVADARRWADSELEAAHKRLPGAKSAIVKCLCKRKFCFLCQNEAHSPATCQEIQEWNKRFETDPMTQRYLATFCKPCPTKEAVDEWKDKLLQTQGLRFEFTDRSHPKSHGCGKMIFKDGGCNHIWSCPCDFHWCWQCGGPYFGTVTDKNGKTNDYHTSGWFNCNNVDQGQLERARNDEAAKLARWQRISDLYATAVNAERKETSDKIRAKVEKMTESMREAEKFKDGDIQELRDAMEALFECRRTVKFFYVKQYTLEVAVEEGVQGAEQEKLQYDLWMDPFVNAVDRLSEMIENPDALEQLRRKGHREKMRKMAQTMRVQCLRALYAES